MLQAPFLPLHHVLQLSLLWTQVSGRLDFSPIRIVNSIILYFYPLPSVMCFVIATQNGLIVPEDLHEQFSFGDVTSVGPTALCAWILAQLCGKMPPHSGSMSLLELFF